MLKQFITACFTCRQDVCTTPQRWCPMATGLSTATPYCRQVVARGLGLGTRAGVHAMGNCHLRQPKRSYGDALAGNGERPDERSRVLRAREVREGSNSNGCR